MSAGLLMGPNLADTGTKKVSCSHRQGLRLHTISLEMCTTSGWKRIFERKVSTGFRALDLPRSDTRRSSRRGSHEETTSNLGIFLGVLGF